MFTLYAGARTISTLMIKLLSIGLLTRAELSLSQVCFFPTSGKSSAVGVLRYSDCSVEIGI